MEVKEQKCGIYKKCNGCQMMNLAYNDQIKYKQKMLGQLLSKLCKVSPVIEMENPYHYRNKVQMAFKKISSKQIYSGIYQSKTDTVTKVSECLLDDKRADAIIATVTKLVLSFKLEPYDFIRQQGYIRHILVRTGVNTDEIMVVLVTTTAMFPSKTKFINALLSRHPEITTVVHSFNPPSNGLVMGEREEVLFGKGYITDKLCDLTFRISPRSFYQVNPSMTEKLYTKAVELAEIKNGDRVLDAYCGTGTISLIAAAKGADVIGVELNTEAYNDAVVNAKLNGIENVQFFNDDAGTFIKGLTENKDKVDVVILDPPRAGSTRTFISCVSELAPEKVVYVSCNPVTLKRDLDFFRYKGYKPVVIQPVDMFPHTHHVETIVLMTKVQK